jgi:hypothetical protein
MQNSARGGSGLGTRIIAWAVLIIVVLFVLKLAVGIALGLVQALVTLALIGLVVMGVLWALRHL